jgi:hypothetical protein
MNMSKEEAVKRKRHWFYCAECGREDFVDVLGGDGVLVVPQAFAVPQMRRGRMR